MKIKPEFKKDAVFFTSDLHFLHNNIIEYCNRPFSNETMTEELINNWNAKVPENGVVFMLGDFCWSNASNSKYKKDWVRIVKQLNGKIYHIRGNHDKFCISGFNVPDLLVQKETTYDILEIKVDKQEIIMCHFPIANWNKKERGSWHLFGHAHGSYNHPHYAAIDVGVDCKYSYYTPLSYDEIETIITKRFLEYGNK